MEKKINEARHILVQNPAHSTARDSEQRKTSERDALVYDIQKLSKEKGEEKKAAYR